MLANDIDALMRHGYDLFPLKSTNKTPLLKGWRTAPSLTALDAARYAKLGIRLTAGQLVIDVDQHENRPHGSVAALAAIDPTVLLAPMALSRNGQHLFFSLPPDFSGKLHHTIRSLPGTEFKTLGRFVVAPCQDGREWDMASSELPAPVVPDSILQLILKPDALVAVGGEGEWSPEELAAALDCLSPEDFREHDPWFSLMCACHEATSGAGLEEFVRWSGGDPEYRADAHIIRSRWATLVAGRAGNAGTGTLLKVLADHDADPPPSVLTRSAMGDFGEVAGDTLPAAAGPMSELDSRYKAVDEDGKLRVYTRRHDDTLGRDYWVRYTRRDFLEVCRAVEHLRVMQCGEKANGDPRMEETAIHWLDHHHKKQTYRGITFAPECDSELTPDGKLNLWRGFAVRPAAGSWEYVKELTYDTLCDRDSVSYEYVMNWLARAVQRPWETGGVALVFRGPKGTGKGTLARAFCRLFGQHGLHITSQTLLVGRFNAHLRDVVALFADEAFWAGDKAGESVLKGLITEPTLAYEGKGENVATGRNCVHMIMASNEDWVVPAGMDGERRFAVFNVADDRHDQKYWDRLNTELSLAGMLRELLARDISSFNHFAVPANRALAEQKLRSMGDVVTWLYETACDGWEDLGPPIDGAYATSDVQASYIRFCDRRNVRGKRASSVVLGMALRKLLPKMRKRRTLLHGTTVQKMFYELPPAAEAVRRIEELVGGMQDMQEG